MKMVFISESDKALKLISSFLALLDRSLAAEVIEIQRDLMHWMYRCH